MSLEKLYLQSPDFVRENIQTIAELFPHCVTESPEGKKIDFDLLRQELQSDVVGGTKERYRLEWPGKREAIVTANLPTGSTLRPVREDWKFGFAYYDLTPVISRICTTNHKD